MNLGSSEINKEYCNTQQLKLSVLMLGLPILVIALYITKFNTVFLPLIIVLVYSIYNLGKVAKSSLVFLIELLVFALLTVLLFNLKYFNSSMQLEGLTAVGDKSFYAQVSAFIKSTGIESCYFDYINTPLRKPIPYHYGENWYTILFSSVFGINEFYSQECLATPFMAGVSLFFIKTIYKNMGLGYITSVVLSFITLLFSGISILNYENIPLFGEMISQFQLNPFSFNKWVFSTLCLSLYFYSLQINKWRVSDLSVLIALFAFLGSISFINILMISLVFYIGQKNVHRKKRVIILVSVLVSILYFGCFYFLYSSYNTQSNYNATDTSFFSTCLAPLAYIKTVINIVGKSLIQLIIIFFPLGLGLLIIRKETYSELKGSVYLTCTVLISGLLIWGALWYSSGSISLFSDASFWFLKLFLFFMLIYSLIKYKVSKFVFISVVVVLVLMTIKPISTLIHNYDEEDLELKKLVEQMNIDEGKSFVYLRVYNPNKSFFSKNLLAFPSIAPITNLNPLHQGLFVDVNQIQPSSDCLTAHRERALVSTSAFSLFISKNKFQSTEEALKVLVKKHEIKYIIAQKDEDFNSITSILRSSIIYENASFILMEIKKEI